MLKKIPMFFVIVAIFLSVCGCVSTPPEPEPENSGADWTAHFLNVGKADCCVLEFDGLFYMIDTATKGMYDTVSAALKQYGVAEIEAVFITHCDNDHIGGLKKLLKNYKVGAVYGSVFTVYDAGINELDDILSGFSMTADRLSAGQTVSVGKSGAYFTVLAPAVQSDDDDNNSLVLRLDGCGNSALFTGDCETVEETQLIGGDIDCDVIKIGHHGKDDASSYSFLREVSPKVAIISTDTIQDPDTAAATVTGTLKLLGANVYITQDYDIAITVTSVGGELKIS